MTTILILETASNSDAVPRTASEVTATQIVRPIERLKMELDGQVPDGAIQRIYAILTGSKPAKRKSSKKKGDT